MVELLDTKQVAKLLRLTPRTLDKWRSAKTHALPYVKVGRKVFYRPEAIDTFIASRTHSGLAPTPRRRRAAKKTI